MKKLLAISIAMMMILSLAACGGGNEEKPSGGIADIGGGSKPQSTGQPDNSQPAVPTETGDSVEVKGDTIIYKTNDGMGTTSVSEYIFKDGALSAISLTLTYGDKATAEKVYDQMKNGELKETADATYKSFTLEDNRILCEMTEDYAAAFAGFSQEQMAALLEGGDPFAGGDTVGGAPSSDGTPSGGITVGEPTMNNAWSDLTLPDGFPKLAEGVTSFSNDIEGTYTFQWDVMPLEECEGIAGKLETWSGGVFELMEDPSAKNWFADTGKHNITLTYYVDTFGAAMPQVMLTVTVW